ncbi:MAG: oxidative damage protection protein [Buchnera aphidicola (Eriosoma harunire)]
MKRMIYCKFFNCILPGLSSNTYPGLLGKKIFNEISEKAWKKWLNIQTKIINEKKINTLIKQDRDKLKQEMINFLFHHEN